MTKRGAAGCLAAVALTVLACSGDESLDNEASAGIASEVAPTTAMSAPTTGTTTPAPPTSLPSAPPASVALGPGCEGPRWQVHLPVGWYFNTFEEHGGEVMEACRSVGPEPIVFSDWAVDDGLGPVTTGWVWISIDTSSWSQVLVRETVSLPGIRTVHSVDQYSVNGRPAVRVLSRNDAFGGHLTAEWWVEAGEGTARIQTGIPTGFDVDTDRLDALDSIVSSLVVLT